MKTSITTSLSFIITWCIPILPENKVSIKIVQRPDWCDSSVQTSSPSFPSLTPWGLVTPYGDRDLGQHWLRQWLIACRYQAITWTNVDLSLVKSSDIHLLATSLEIPQPSISKCSLKITYLKSHSNLTGANELKKTHAWTGWMDDLGWMWNSLTRWALEHVAVIWKYNFQILYTE